MHFLQGIYWSVTNFANVIKFLRCRNKFEEMQNWAKSFLVLTANDDL